MGLVQETVFIEANCHAAPGHNPMLQLPAKKIPDVVHANSVCTERHNLVSTSYSFEVAIVQTNAAVGLHTGCCHCVQPVAESQRLQS